jgi:hypothetical protein
LAEAAGASFVARGTAANIRPLERMIKQGIEHHGFSFVEAVVPCPTEYGKRNPPAGVTAMLDDAKARSVSVSGAAKLSPEELQGKIVTGVLHRDDGAPEFGDSYADIVERAQGAAAAAKGRPRREAVPATEPASCGLPADLSRESGPAESAPGASSEEVREAAEAAGAEAAGASPAEEGASQDAIGLPCEGGE